MQNTHEEHRNYQSEDLVVVSPSHAVVEPETVVVKVGHAPVTLPTMLCMVVDVGLAHLAVELELTIVKVFPGKG